MYVMDTAVATCSVRTPLSLTKVDKRHPSSTHWSLREAVLYVLLQFNWFSGFLCDLGMSPNYSKLRILQNYLNQFKTEGIVVCLVRDTPWCFQHFSDARHCKFLGISTNHCGDATNSADYRGQLRNRPSNRHWFGWKGLESGTSL